VSTPPPNVEGFRAAARRRLPRVVFDFVDGGAGDELTVASNRAAFERVQFAPRVLVDCSQRELSTSFCGQHLDLPIMLAPTGLSGLVHPDGELGAALAAANLGTISMLSRSATYSMEEICSEVMTPPWLQVYPDRDESLLDRAKACGIPGVCVTVDTPVGSRRDRDLANGWTTPLKLRGRASASFARHPAWVVSLLRHRRVMHKNLEPSATQPNLVNFVSRASTTAGLAHAKSPRKVSWDDVRWLRSRWTGPLAIKGILTPGDAAQAIDYGVDGIIVSNHGGRQLDGARAALDALPDIVEVAGSAVDVAVDGGVRRGTDVIKALALGARACLIGRPWLYGLAVAGARGVEDVVNVLRAELDIGLALVGQPRVLGLDRSYLVADRPDRPAIDAVSIDGVVSTMP
jgi:isopentenyl diphosphate isomerase/L-lactate dehydrogenase-like FMN-dependent dehydrogenase